MVSVRHLKTRLSFHQGLILDRPVRYRLAHQRGEYDIPVSTTSKIMDARGNIHRGERQSQTDRDEENPKPGRPLDQFEDSRAVDGVDDVEQCQAGKNPPRIPHERLVRSDSDIEVVDVVEEAIIVGDLPANERDGESQSPQVDPAHPLTGFWSEHASRVEKEGFNFHPRHDVVDDPGEIQEHGG